MPTALKPRAKNTHRSASEFQHCPAFTFTHTHTSSHYIHHLEELHTYPPIIPSHHIVLSAPDGCRLPIESVSDEDDIVWYWNNDVTLDGTHERACASDFKAVNDAGTPARHVNAVLSCNGEPKVTVKISLSPSVFETSNAAYFMSFSLCALKLNRTNISSKTDRLCL